MDGPKQFMMNGMDQKVLLWSPQCTQNLDCKDLFCKAPQFMTRNMNSFFCQTDVWVIFNRAHSGDSKDPIFMADPVTGSCAIGGCTQFRWCGFILLNFYHIICDEGHTHWLCHKKFFLFLPIFKFRSRYCCRDDQMLYMGHSIGNRVKTGLEIKMECRRGTEGFGGLHI